MERGRKREEGKTVVGGRKGERKRQRRGTADEDIPGKLRRSDITTQEIQERERETDIPKNINADNNIGWLFVVGGAFRQFFLCCTELRGEEI